MTQSDFFVFHGFFEFFGPPCFIFGCHHSSCSKKNFEKQEKIIRFLMKNFKMDYNGFQGLKFQPLLRAWGPV